MTKQGFTLSCNNGWRMNICKSVFDKRQKSYDIMLNNGKDNCWYKVGIIRDMDKMREMFDE